MLGLCPADASTRATRPIAGHRDPRVLARTAAPATRHRRRVNLSAPRSSAGWTGCVARGVIDAFTVRLDPSALGWGTEAFVEVHCAEQTSPARMREAFERYPEVVVASSVTGDADAVVQVRAHDMRHLEQVVERIAAEPFVRRTRSTVVLSALVRRDDVPRT